MGYAPNSVKDDNAHEVRLTRYLRTKKKRTLKFKFNVGDKVRVSYTHLSINTIKMNDCYVFLEINNNNNGVYHLPIGFRSKMWWYMAHSINRHNVEGYK